MSQDRVERHGPTLRLQSPLGGELSVEITLIRHAETESNAAGEWQGRSDSDFSERGDEQLSRLSEVGRQRGVALVVASPLGRAQRTAAVFGDFETDERWAEIDLGSWDGLTSAEVARRHPDAAVALSSGDDVTPEGGESTAEFAKRLMSGLDAVVDRLDDGDRALVATHGGAIHVLVSRILGLEAPSRLRFPRNTAATTIRVDGKGRRGVSVYNDAAHLNGRGTAQAPGATEVLLFRHGETDGNVTQRWQGRSEGMLTETGRRQANELVAVAPDFERLYSSPLSRARETAAVVAERRGLEVGVVDDLMEMDFGSWENLTADEAAAQDPDMFNQIFTEGRDLPRGGSGERFADAGARVADAVAELAASDGSKTIAAVGHGGATRAYVSNVLGLSFADRHSLGSLRNTAMVAVSYGEGGPTLSAYNVAPHLGG